MISHNILALARRGLRSFGAALVMTWSVPAALSQSTIKPLLTPADYDHFEFLYGGVLSRNGLWLAHSILKVNDTSQVHIRRVSGGDATIVAWGSGPVFAPSARWVTYTVGVSPTERQRLERDKKPVRSAVVLRELETGHETRFEQVVSRAFDKSGKYLALLGYAPDEPKGRGADLRVVPNSIFPSNRVRPSPTPLPRGIPGKSSMVFAARFNRTAANERSLR